VNSRPGGETTDNKRFSEGKNRLDGSIKRRINKKDGKK
jgi:hypothetical protein